MEESVFDSSHVLFGACGTNRTLVSTPHLPKLWRLEPRFLRFFLPVIDAIDQANEPKPH